MNGKLAKRLRRAALGLASTLDDAGIKISEREVIYRERQPAKLSEKSFRSIYKELKQNKW